MGAKTGQKHGRDHAAGGSDPVPADSRIIMYDVDPQVGGALDVETTGSAGQKFNAGTHNIKLNGGSTVANGTDGGQITVTTNVQIIGGSGTQAEIDVGTVADNDIETYSKNLRVHMGTGSSGFVVLHGQTSGTTKIFQARNNGGSDAIGFFNVGPALQQSAPSTAQDIATALAAYGLLASAGTVTSAPSGSAGGDLTGSYPNPTLGSGAFGTPAVVLGTAAAAGSSSDAVRTDATIVAFDATAPTTQAFGDTAATGSAAVAARRDHVHAMPATPVTSLNKTGATALTGAVTLTGGTNITLTQVGQDISIAATGGGGGIAMDSANSGGYLDVTAGSADLDGNGISLIATTASALIQSVAGELLLAGGTAVVLSAGNPAQTTYVSAESGTGVIAGIDTSETFQVFNHLSAALFKVSEAGEIFAFLPTVAGTSGSLYNASGFVKVSP